MWCYRNPHNATDRCADWHSSFGKRYDILANTHIHVPIIWFRDLFSRKICTQPLYKNSRWISALAMLFCMSYASQKKGCLKEKWKRENKSTHIHTRLWVGSKGASVAPHRNGLGWLQLCTSPCLALTSTWWQSPRKLLLAQHCNGSSEFRRGGGGISSTWLPISRYLGLVNFLFWECKLLFREWRVTSYLHMKPYSSNHVFLQTHLTKMHLPGKGNWSQGVKAQVCSWKQVGGGCAELSGAGGPQTYLAGRRSGVKEMRVGLDG